MEMPEHAIMKFGVVTEVDYAKGMARVLFTEDDLVSNWLPVSVPKSRNDKNVNFVDKDDYVWCILDEQCEYGVIGGAIYSETNKPNGSDKKIGVTYSDGSELYYDKQNKEWKLKVNNTILSVKDGQTTFNDGSNGGLAIVSKIQANLAALKTYVEAMNTALPSAFTAVGVGAAAAGSAGASSYNLAMAGKTITLENMENTKVKH